MKSSRYLTKSRFKLALDCPTKLYYTRKAEYENIADTDSFLEQLAQGGFQVEELARMEHPGGIALTGDDYDYQKLADETRKLLTQDEVTIFEPAFLINGLFIRVDILVKKGNKVRLLEVKAKSVSGERHESYLNKKGNKLQGGMDHYLYDVAFQKYVMQLCYPQWEISSFLKLVNKDASTTVDGLHQCFKVVADSNLRTGIEKKEGLIKEDLGDSILCEVNIDAEVKLILNQNPMDEALSFEEMLNLFRNHYQEDRKLFLGIGGHCKSCEFKSEPASKKKSGFHECWVEELKLPVAEIDEPKIYDVWYNPARKLLEEGKYFMKEISEEDFTVKPEAEKLSRSERQWLQIEKTVKNDNTPYFEIENLRAELASWKFPLNFIDFETTAVALPFFKGMRPYEQLAFQFSHHIVHEDGSVEHFNEYLNSGPGEYPNFDFIRALKKSLEGNYGSIFRYHNHENTIINVIYDQLRNSGESDKEELLQFIESISHNTSRNAKSWKGERDMIDLQKTVVNYYYDPVTGGSNSIKAVLPAVLQSSSYLQEKYQKPLSEIDVSSKNFEPDHIFLRMENGKAVSPYKALPPVFDNWDSDKLEEIAESIAEIADGGAALFAYQKLKYPDLAPGEREAINQALLRYCEMDTLAMVMVYEYFREVCKPNLL
ncbi:DUF2779 domain-containing protein [Salegentibacter mishustinae]|uniref:DUF2779 domain-containing protein n=1 Tax=Salegentibacter mishustinae TaxID=270918 RepID=UPI001CE0CBAA|nr:DUF2779 domain-containing protein [Salegentibacter mishustinae]UBZ07267.1 DUF2779 domain-containing protein [Salegentibacter mishustinae]